MPKPLITILGPTACGKTELACHLASNLKAEIISADSRQVYRGMDIGTGKDLDEYIIDGEVIPVHLIDIHDPGYKYNIAEYQVDFHKVYNQLNERDIQAILCGGSGLYIEAALRGNSYLGIPSDPSEKKDLNDLTEEEFEKLYQFADAEVKEAIGDQTKPRKVRAIQVSNYLKLHPDWEKRAYPEVPSIIFGLTIDRDLRRSKISKRLSFRLNNGLIEEAESLLSKGLSHESMAYYGLEYKWLSDYLLSKITKKELYFGLETAIHQFSKRQMTWFRRMEKNNYKIHWIEAASPLDDKLSQVGEICKSYPPLK